MYVRKTYITATNWSYDTEVHSAHLYYYDIPVNRPGKYHMHSLIPLYFGSVNISRKY